MIDTSKIHDLDIREALEFYGVEFKHNGFARCPFHSEKTASFNTDEKKNLYFCFGCGAGGDLISFVRQMYGLTFAQACNKIDNDFMLGLTSRKLTYAEQKQIADERKITESMRAWRAEEKAKIDKLIDRRRKIFKISIRNGDRYQSLVDKLDYEIDLRLSRIETI